MKDEQIRGDGSHIGTGSYWSGSAVIEMPQARPTAEETNSSDGAWRSLPGTNSDLVRGVPGTLVLYRIDRVFEV